MVLQIVSFFVFILWLKLEYTCDSKSKHSWRWSLSKIGKKKKKIVSRCLFVSIFIIYTCLKYRCLSHCCCGCSILGIILCLIAGIFLFATVITILFVHLQKPPTQSTPTTMRKISVISISFLLQAICFKIQLTGRIRKISVSNIDW